MKTYAEFGTRSSAATTRGWTGRNRVRLFNEFKRHFVSLSTGQTASLVFITDLGTLVTQPKDTSCSTKPVSRLFVAGPRQVVARLKDWPYSNEPISSFTEARSGTGKLVARLKDWPYSTSPSVPSLKLEAELAS